MQLDELIAGLPSELEARVVAGEARSVRVCDLTEDSRTAVPGSVFFARPGLSVDGRSYAASAIECGAVAVVTDEPEIDLGRLPSGMQPAVVVVADVALAAAHMGEHFFGSPTDELVLIGVTGTNGKTTVSHFVHRLLNRAGVRCGLIGTVEIDDGRERTRAAMTTPPALELSRTFATMAEAGCRAAVMEVSSHALDQRRADALAFDIGIFTNLSGDHLDYHGSMESYAGAKRRLFELLDQDGIAIGNTHDAHSEQIAGRRAIRCGLGGAGDESLGWSVEVLAESSLGSRVLVRGLGEPLEIQTRFVGGFNAMNLLQSIAASDAAMKLLGIDADERGAMLAESAQGLKAPAGRLEMIDSGLDGAGRGPAVLVDFAHTDDALGRCLEAVRPIVRGDGKLWVVFGCGGDRDATKRPRMGQAAAAGADRIVVTSDNPRTESPSIIVDEILTGIETHDRGRVEVHVDRQRAIRFAISNAATADVVVIAGRGHEREQIVADGMGGVVRRAFDDRVVAREALRETELRRADSEALPS